MVDIAGLYMNIKKKKNDKLWMARCLGLGQLIVTYRKDEAPSHCWEDNKGNNRWKVLAGETMLDLKQYFSLILDLFTFWINSCFKQI